MPTRRLHRISIALAGLALLASVLGWQRVAVLLLALAIIIHAVSLDGLRSHAESSEKRP